MPARTPGTESAEPHSSVIRTAALAHVRGRRLLQARSQGKTAFYMAGGKIDPGEDAEQALHREIREELDAGIVPGTLERLGVFEAPAFGHRPGTALHMTCFTAELTSEPRATSEIAELRYFTLDEYAAMPEVAPGSLLVFRRLRALGLID
ncbi:NUDIX hydrolase [Rhodococcus triatomae]|uniref:NUDIX hydrolase n=1 Tax=Rhodococcus triatomae TaxID=300028 RepID=UPI000934E251|nr:NUDIX domain-containing protein [Rhodococcus triatomae]